MENQQDQFACSHYQQFIEARERAMTNLHKFFMDEQMAQYHLMMYTRTRRPIQAIEPPKKEVVERPYTPFPEDI